MKKYYPAVYEHIVRCSLVTKQLLDGTGKPHISVCVCGYEKARGKICKFCSVSTEWEIKFNKIVSTWKEPEWVWQRHDLLIDYTSALIKTIKPFIHSLFEEQEKIRKELLKELDNARAREDFMLDEIKQAREAGKQEERGAVWDMMITSLPKDAENLSTLTPDQALKVVKGLMQKLKER